MGAILRLLRALPLLLVSPLMVAVSAAASAFTDLCWVIFGGRRPLADAQPSTRSVSIVIPSWNTRDLLEKYLPFVIEAVQQVPGSEIIVVDNGSSDESAAFVRDHFPQVNVLALDRNLGFGGGSNAGFCAARNDIVVLLNSDMRVDAGFIRPLLGGFSDSQVFAVSCQIFFSDPNRVREETGLTQCWWENGALRARHRADDAVTSLYPCFYGGGGSCAFDRRKFLELGGFDELLAPFYFEDTDLGYMAWKRGWKILYQPASIVFHEHRGTIGRRFSNAQIQAILKKNQILFCWKNIHDWRRLTAHYFFTWANAVVSAFAGDSPERPNLSGLGRAFLQLPGAMASRWRARSLAVVDDTEAFRRPLGGYYRDRFAPMDSGLNRLRVLFVSPYPICPPVHGGGVFMYQTLCELVQHCEVHLIALLDKPGEIELHQDLAARCASAEFLIRMEGKEKALGSIVPHAVHEFTNADLEWLIHRQIHNHQIDLIQLEYTPLAQYAADYRRIPNVLFEHDIYFQSISRGLPRTRGLLRKARNGFEYLRALRYELSVLPRQDRIQVCSRENGKHLLEFLPELAGKIDDSVRAGIDTARYAFKPDGREPLTMLFLGSFRHVPNQEALDWFARRVFPVVLQNQPDARLIVIGSDAPPRHSLPESDHVELVGFVEDIREPLARYAVFVCPILSGSGVRVKLLEAFAAGIPVVSTTVGAEGLAQRDGEVCALADSPEHFARRILDLFQRPDEAAAMAGRARAEVEANWDMAVLTRRLASTYVEAVKKKRGGAISRPYPV